MIKIIVLSGGMDCLHIGHIKMIQAAAKIGKVVIALNSNEWLLRKKGFYFMPWEERAEILMALKDVHNVVPVDDSDGTVCDALRRFKPDYFGNGGDRGIDNTPEKQICEELGIEMTWNLGGTKIQSSSDLVNKIMGKRL